MMPTSEQCDECVSLYVSGPVTGREGRNREAFEEAERRLWIAGFEVCLPHRNVPKNLSWADAMKLAISVMLRCDGVARLPDWRESRGARIEVRLALDLGMPVRDVDEWCRSGEA